MLKKLDLGKIQKLANLLGRPMHVIINSLGDTEDFLLQQAEQASTIQQAREAYIQALERSEAEKLALKKWEELSLRQAEQASTIQQAKEAYDQAPGGSEAEKLAMKKWIGFCSTIQQAREAYDHVPRGSEAEKLAMKKMCELI